MTWLWWLLAIPYFAIGTIIGVPFAQWVFDGERDNAPSIERRDPRYGLGSATGAFFLAFFGWPVWVVAILPFVGLYHLIVWFMTRAVLPEIHENERKEIQ